jgi:hypothetical protein
MAMIRLCLIDKLGAVAATGPLSIKEHKKSTQARCAKLMVFRSSDEEADARARSTPTIDRRQRDNEENLTTGGRTRNAAWNGPSP